MRTRKNRSRPKARLSVGERSGIIALATAFLLGFVDLSLAALPLVLFLIVCMVALFLPGASFYLPVISRGCSGKMAVALTFDDGPDPGTTPQLLQLLGKHRAAASFFVNGGKASRHPRLIKQMVARGHAVCNHSYRHDNLLLLKNPDTVYRDIEAAQAALRKLGVIALAFRPPAGITTPRLQRALERTNLFTVNYSCRALDFGNRRVRHLARRILSRVRPDDIILLHDVTPTPADLMPEWLAEVEKILTGLKDRGLSVLPLSEIIGKPVMVPVTGKKGALT